MTESSERIDFKIDKLKGSENYDSWELDISSVLMAKGVDQFLDESPDQTQAKDTQKFKLAWSIMIQSLSNDIKASLSPSSRDRTTASASVLFAELKTSYAATKGGRVACLIEDMFNATVQDDDDPMVALGKIRLAHTQLSNCGETLSQHLLAIAMLRALPGSFDPVAQT